MEWFLWLDDVRVPFIGTKLVELDKYRLTECPVSVSMAEWCKSTDEAKKCTRMMGAPSFMYLDHDLGVDDTSMDYLKWLQNVYPDLVIDYTIISANPIGAKNIQAFMNSWKKVAESDD